MDRPLDVLFVAASSTAAAYQALGREFSAVEPPTWALLLAESCRVRGFGVAILDCAAERLDDESAVRRIGDAAPRLVCFVVYGQNPNAGTVNMAGATRLARHVKMRQPDAVVGFVGSHPAAVPREVLALDCVDIVFLNEGVYALHDLLRTNLRTNLDRIAGIGHKEDGMPRLTGPGRVVPPDRMDIDLPGYAWDLLPRRGRPLDLYRAHIWHADFDSTLRTPFAAIHTSIGCPFRCDFCMVNIVNRTDPADRVSAADSAARRCWSPGFVLAQLDRLAELGVSTVRISDEMFFLDRDRYGSLLQAVADRAHAFRLWAYARVDTVRPADLECFRRAGIGWLALGIESASRTVRRAVSKGSFRETNIREICRAIRDAGLHVIANYVLGLPDDTPATMQETLDLALDLNTEMANFYPCQALPGSPLHRRARANGWTLPDSYEGYGFLSYESQPLPTKHCTAAEVLRFRDHAWHTYFTAPAFLAMVERTFGPERRRAVEAMAAVSVRRRLLGDPPPEPH